MYGVGKILRFQTHAAAVIVHSASLAGLLLDKVARIELHTGQSGIDLHGSAADRRLQRGKMTQLPVPSVNDPIVVVSSRKLQLFKIGSDIPSHSLGYGKIHRRALYLCHLSGRDGSPVRRSIAGSTQPQLMPFYASAVMSLQVEIGMVRGIQYRPLVADAMVVNRQSILLVQKIRDADLLLPRKS